MKTLADLKRRLTPGLAVTVEFPGSVIRGNCGDTVLPGRTVTRKVHEIRPTMVIWESERFPGQKGSRLDLIDAGRFTVSENAFAVAHEAGGTPFATYRFN